MDISYLWLKVSFKMLSRIVNDLNSAISRISDTISYFKLNPLRHALTSIVINWFWQTTMKLNCLENNVNIHNYQLVLSIEATSLEPGWNSWHLPSKPRRWQPNPMPVVNYRHHHHASHVAFLLASTHFTLPTLIPNGIQYNPSQSWHCRQTPPTTTPQLEEQYTNK